MRHRLNELLRQASFQWLRRWIGAQEGDHLDRDMSIKLTISGLNDVKHMIDPSRFSDEMDSAVDQAAAMLRDETKRMPAVSASRTGYAAKGIPVAPKYGGTLRQSIRKRKLGVLMAEVSGGASYSGYVHEGTSKMPARPFFKWLLEDFQGAKKVEAVFERAFRKHMKS